MSDLTRVQAQVVTCNSLQAEYMYKVKVKDLLSQLQAPPLDRGLGPRRGVDLGPLGGALPPDIARTALS